MPSNQASSSRSSSTSGVVTPSNSGSISSNSPSDGRRRSPWGRIAEDGSMRPASGAKRTPPYLHQCITTTEDPDTSDEEEDDEGIADLEPAVGATEGGEGEDLEATQGDGSLSSHSSLVLRSEESSAASGEEHASEMGANDETHGSAGEDFGAGREVAESGLTMPVCVINVSSDSSDDSDYLVVTTSTASKRRVTSVKRPTGSAITYGQLKRRRPNYASDDDDLSDDIMELKPPVQKKRSNPNSFANFVVPRSRLLDGSNGGDGASGDVVVSIDSKPAVGSNTNASLLSTYHPRSVKSLPTSCIQLGGSPRTEAYGSHQMSVEQRAALAQGLPLDAVLPTLSGNEASSPSGIMAVSGSPRLRNPPSPPQLTDDATREDGEINEEVSGAGLGWVSNAIVKEFNHRAPGPSRARASHASQPERSLVPMQTSSDGFNWSRRWGVTPWPQSTIYAEIERRQSKWPEAYQEINRGIWQHLGANLQNADTYLWKMGVRQQIEALIKQELPNSHLIAVGSTINGCGSYNSDMDLCLCVYDHRGQLHEKRGFAQRNLRRLHRQLYQLPIVEEVEYINAKVPILRLDLRPPYDTLQIDINVNNTPGIYNSYLLHYYSRLDDRFPALCLVLKHWAKNVGIGDASEGSFNSYSLNLMVLHFLQVGTSPPVLPNLLKLYPKYFAVNQPLGGMKLFSDLPKPPPPAPKNDRSVAQLLVALFDYYSNFNYDFHAISIAEGRVIPRHTLSRHTDRYPIFIEEPYERKNTARCVSNTGMWGRIQAAFNEARDALHRGRKPPSLEALKIRPEDY